MAREVIQGPAQLGTWNASQEVFTRFLADTLRRGLILGIWGSVTYLLWSVWWVWAALWAIPGFIIILNVVGFATFPLYVLIAKHSPERKEFDRFLKQFEDDPTDSA